MTRSIDLRGLALAALALFVFSIPSENAVSVGGVGSLSRLIALAAAGLTLLSLFFNGRFRFRIPSLFVMTTVLLVLWMTASYFWSVVPNVTFSRITTMLQLAVFVWMLHQVPQSQRDRTVLMQAFVLGCYLTIGIVIALFLVGPTDYYRQSGPFNPNGLAVVSGLAIPVAWMLALHYTTGWLRWANALYPLFALFVVVLSASRGGLLTTLVALLIIPATLPRLGIVRGVAVTMLFAVLAVGALEYLPRAFPALERNVERLMSTSEELQGGSFTGRTYIWSAGLEVLRDSPVVGVGVGGFNHATYLIRGRAQSPHNAFLSVAVGSGLIGLVLYLALFVIALAGILMVREHRIELLVLFGALVVGMMPTNSDNDKFAWFLLAMIAVLRPINLRIGSWSVATRAAEPGPAGSRRVGAGVSIVQVPPKYP